MISESRQKKFYQAEVQNKLSRKVVLKLVRQTLVWCGRREVLLRKIKFLPSETLEKIYFIMIVPKITYGLLVWGTCSKNLLQKIECQHIKAARTVRKTNEKVKDVEVLQRVNWNNIDTGGGGSSIVKVPGDVPPARVCFFKPSSLAKGILFANFRPFSLGKGKLLAILVKELSNFGNSCKET